MADRRFSGRTAASRALVAGVLAAMVGAKDLAAQPDVISTQAEVKAGAAADDPLAYPVQVKASAPAATRPASPSGSVPLVVSAEDQGPPPTHGAAAGGDPPAVVFDIGGAADPMTLAQEPPKEMEFSADPAARSFDLTAKATASAEAQPQGKGPPAPGPDKSFRLVRRDTAEDRPVLARADIDEILKLVYPAAPGGARPDGVRSPDPSLTIIPLAAPGADEPDDERDVIDTLTLGDYVIRTVRRSESLAAENYALKAAKLQAVSSLTSLGPHVSFNWEQGHEHSYSSVPSSPVTLPDHERTDAIAVLSQPLFDPVTLAALDRDRESARAAEMKRRMAEVNAAYEAVAAYFDLLDATLQLELAKGHEQRMDNLLDYMKRRTALGGSSEADLKRVQAVALTAERNRVDVQASLDSAISNLRRLAGVSAVQIAAPSVVEARVPSSSDEAYKRLVKFNPDLRWAYIQIKIAHDESLQAAAQILPKISFNLGRYANTNPSGAQGTTIDKRALFNGQWSFGSGTEIAQSLSEQAHAEELKHRYYDLLRSAQDRMRTLYLNLNSLDGQRAIAWKEFKANDQVTAAFDEQLFAANRSILDVLDTYQKFYQSKVNVVQLTLSQIKTAYQIRQLVGDLNQDNADEGLEGSM